MWAPSQGPRKEGSHVGAFVGFRSRRGVRGGGGGQNRIPFRQGVMWAPSNDMLHARGMAIMKILGECHLSPLVPFAGERCKKGSDVGALAGFLSKEGNHAGTLGIFLLRRGGTS